MTTYKRICIKTHTATDWDGDPVPLLQAGKVYITSPEHDDGTVTVYSTYWVRVPAEIFAGAEQFTGARDQ